MIRLVMAGFVSMSLLAAAAQQDSQKTDKKGTQQSDQTERASKIGQEGSAEQADQKQREELPESLTRLDLTDQQKTKLLAIYRESDQKSQQLWDRVQDLHRQAISMEAAVIAATRLEGHDHSAHTKSDAQPANTDQRKANAQSDKDVAAGATNKDGAKQVTSNQRTPDNAENQKEEQNRRDDQSGNKSLQATNDSADERNNLNENLNIVAIRVAVVQPNGRVREHLLTQAVPQEDAGSNNEAFQKCQSQLSQVWKDIHEGHEQLVELEANTIVQVEAELTEAQLQELDATQSQASATPRNQNDNSGR